MGLPFGYRSRHRRYQCRNRRLENVITVFNVMGANKISLMSN